MQIIKKIIRIQQNDHIFLLSAQPANIRPQKEYDNTNITIHHLNIF